MHIFEMAFYPISPTGKVGVLITLEENVPTEYRAHEKDKLKLELIVEPASIDIFSKGTSNIGDKSGWKSPINRSKIKRVRKGLKRIQPRARPQPPLVIH